MEVHCFERGELCCELAPSTPVIKYDSIFIERIFHALHVVHALLTEQPPYIRALFVILIKLVIWYVCILVLLCPGLICVAFIYIQAVITSVGEERAKLSAVFTGNYVVSVRRGFLFLWVLEMGYVILLWHSLSLSYKVFSIQIQKDYG